MNDTLEKKDLPELGTPEAAVQTCVNLIARATGKSEDILAYWLDLYYQVRSAYEDAEHNRQLLEQWRTAPNTYQPSPGTGKPIDSVHEDIIFTTDAPAPPAEPEGSPPEPPTPKTSAANAAFKRETRERLLQLRADGLTMARLLEMADGTVKEGAIRDIIDAHTVPLAVYRKLAKVLDKIQTET